MSKQTKITIILDQPLFGDFTESIGRELLEQRLCFGVYSSFSQDRVTFEEIDSDPIYITIEQYKSLPKDQLKFYVLIKQHRARAVYSDNGNILHPPGAWCDGLPSGIHWNEDYETQDIYKRNELVAKIIDHFNRAKKDR